MSEGLIVQYVGLEANAIAREYSFLVREPPGEPREFTLTIVNEAFDSHRVRYQDAPDICSFKLHHELAVYANHPRQHVSESAKPSWMSTATPTHRRLREACIREGMRGSSSRVVAFSHSCREDSGGARFS